MSKKKKSSKKSRSKRRKEEASKNQPPEQQDNGDANAYAARLQRRLRILEQELKSGKISIAEGLGVIESLKAVRYKEDGSFDLETVDGRVRSLALVAELQHDREQAKKVVSLAEIQGAFFSILEINFKQFYDIMISRGMTPHDAGMAASSSPLSITEVTNTLPKFLGMLEEFWGSVAQAGYIHVEDMHGVLKGVFGGDIFPAHNENIASKCGIYTDTLVLPEPFMKCKDLFKFWKPKDQAYYFIKNAMNLLQYRKLACAEVNPPIVVVLPERTSMDRDEMQFMAKLGKQDALIHGGKVFGRDFESFEEMMDFAGKLATPELLVSAVKDENRMLFDADWKGSFREKIAQAESRSEMFPKITPGLMAISTMTGRMAISNELLIGARRLGGTPVIDAPTSWQYFVWKLEYDAEKAQRDLSLSHLHVISGLQSLADNEMEWLGKVPVDSLIEVRKVGAMSEIRGILGKGISDLVTANPTNFYRTSDRIFDNIQSAFEEHKKNIDALIAKKWKFAGSDIGSWLVVGSLAVTAAATGQPVWGLAAYAADQLLAPQRLREIPDSIKKLADETKRLKQSPTGLLFKCSQMNS